LTGVFAACDAVGVHTLALREARRGRGFRSEIFAQARTASDQMIGTSAPRDSRSPLEHPAWLSHNRVATFLESTVPPGGVATFRFPIAMGRGVIATSEFEIVVERECWIPNTRFAVTVTGRGRSRRRSQPAESR
jgi:hypothetical protein